MYSQARVAIHSGVMLDCKLAAIIHYLPDGYLKNQTITDIPIFHTGNMYRTLATLFSRNH